MKLRTDLDGREWIGEKEVMKIDILPAQNGDCILVEYTPNRYILIDGGYVDTYRNHLLPKLNIIAEAGGVVDVVIVTHIDSDHISGIVKMFEEDELPVRVGEIWYNGYRHIQSAAIISEEKETVIHRSICKESHTDKTKPVSAKQGCTLSRLITISEIPWNKPVDGGRIMAPLSFSLGKATIHILSPNKGNIDDLETMWKKRLIKDGLLKKPHSDEYWDDAYEFSLSQDKPGFHFHRKTVSKSFDLQKIKSEPYEPDTSATNGSSIAFVLEIDSKRVLFLGDAFAETIVSSLKQLYGKDMEPYRFDAVKLSHHGSYNNNSPELFNLIETDKWIISTNGDKYNHPDLPTLAYIITHKGTNKIYFNYILPICEELRDNDYHKDYTFEIIAPKECGNGIQIEL